METKGIRRFAAVLAALALVAAFGYGLHSTAETPVLTETDIASILDTTTDQAQITNPIIQTANKAQQSVVGVNNYQSRRVSPYGGAFGFGFDNRPGTNEEVRVGTGSGTAISPWGHVLTNYHVVNDATRVTVTYGGKELEAVIVGTDQQLDIAILLVPGLDLPHVQLGDSDALQVGEYAIVIGNPLGQEFERSVTVGVVSAVQRAITSQSRDRFGLRTEIKNQMIQVDAPISSGNSGGAMFNILGQLQGIPTLKLTDRGQGFFNPGYSVDNIGMCVPINAAKPLIREVLEKYDPNAVQELAEQNRAEQPELDAANRPRLGVSIGTLSPSFQPVAQGIIPQGAYISNVEPGSPAQTAGLQVGDIIVEANGTIIPNHTTLIELLRQASAGDQVQIKVYRVAGLPEAMDNTRLFSELGEGEYLDFTVELRIIIP